LILSQFSKFLNIEHCIGAVFRMSDLIRNNYFHKDFFTENNLIRNPRNFSIFGHFFRVKLSRFLVGKFTVLYTC
jgi:hypothetical protein